MEDSYRAEFYEVVSLFEEVRHRVGYLLQPTFVVENHADWGDVAGFCCEEGDEILFGINGPFADRDEMLSVIIHESVHLKQESENRPVCHDLFFIETEKLFKILCCDLFS